METHPADQRLLTRHPGLEPASLAAVQQLCCHAQGQMIGVMPGRNPPAHQQLGPHSQGGLHPPVAEIRWDLRQDRLLRIRWYRQGTQVALDHRQGALQAQSADEDDGEAVRSECFPGISPQIGPAEGLQRRQVVQEVSAIGVPRQGRTAQQGQPQDALATEISHEGFACLRKPAQLQGAESLRFGLAPELKKLLRKLRLDHQGIRGGIRPLPTSPGGIQIRQG